MIGAVITNNGIVWDIKVDFFYKEDLGWDDVNIMVVEE